MCFSISDYFISHLVRNEVTSSHIIPTIVHEIVASFLASNIVLPVAQIGKSLISKHDIFDKEQLMLKISISNFMTNLDLSSITLKFDRHKKMEYRIFYKINKKSDDLGWKFKDIDLTKPSTFSCSINSGISLETHRDSLMELPTEFLNASPTSELTGGGLCIIRGLKLEKNKEYVLCVAPIGYRVCRSLDEHGKDEDKKERYYGAVIEKIGFTTPSWSTMNTMEP